ncbi:hypothetical protein C8J57DRAFT_1251971 [Mycena rebaudengoi]|nr:hypothetical protein C8J57DRAFT_1251971 [Mycena rebaudengoi]
MGDSASPTSLFRRINPPPTNWSKWCPECNTPSLKPPFECKGNGEDIHNYGRWTQPCDNGDCNNWLWHNAPTELDHIPYEVQMRHTIKKSARDEGDVALLCPANGCRTAAKNVPRKANRECTRTVPQCSSCCKAAGGCGLNAHRPSGRNLASYARNPDISMAMSQAVGSLSAPEPVRREYARPLNEFYGKPYVASHRHLLVESSKVAAEERIKDLAYVVLWISVYRYMDNLLRDYSAPNNPDIDVEVFDCVTEGEKFIVNLACFTVVGHLQMNPITIAVKKLRSDDWAMNFPSLAAVVWTEGARTATCHMLFEHFKCRALAVGVTVPENLDVAETSYIDLADTSPEGDVAWVGQPWHIGAPFSIHSLDLNDPNQVDIYSICHYILVPYADIAVGLITPHNNFVVLDSRTDVAHTSPMDDFAGDDDFKPPQFSVNNAPYFLGSLGDAGLAAFQTTHNCTGICGMMQLNPLPLIFP